MSRIPHYGTRFIAVSIFTGVLMTGTITTTPAQSPALQPPDVTLTPVLVELFTSQG